VICGYCGSRLFTDDYPGGPIPPYCCLNCKSSWPLSQEEELTRRKAKREAEARALRKSESAKRRVERGEPVVWVRETKLTPNQKRKIKIQARMDEILAKPPDTLTKREWKWLAEVWSFLTRGSRRGRKKNAQYDEWLTKEARARLSGDRRPLLRDLARKQLPQTTEEAQESSFKAEMDRLRDAFKKARKRRQLPAPPMR